MHIINIILIRKVNLRIVSDICGKYLKINFQFLFLLPFFHVQIILKLFSHGDLFALKQKVPRNSITLGSNIQVWHQFNRLGL